MVNIKGIIDWIGSQAVTLSILGFLLFVIIYLWMRRSIRLKREGRVFSEEADRIIALRERIEQLDSTKSGREAVEKVEATARGQDVPARIRDSVLEYMQVLLASNRIYDPELFIRQKFKQLIQERLLGGGEDFIRLGLVGTFIGLVAGLICLDASDSNALFASVSTMLSSMGLAFVSSLMGLLAAIVYRRRCSIYEDQYEHWEDELSSMLSRSIGSIVVTDSDQRIGEVANVLGKSIERLAALIENMGRSSDQMAESSSKLETTIVELRDAAVKMTSGSFEELGRISASIESSTMELASSLPKLVEDNSGVRRNLDATMDQLTTMSKNLSGAIGVIAATSIHSHLEDLCHSVEQLVNQLENDQKSRSGVES